MKAKHEPDDRSIVAEINRLHGEVGEGLRLTVEKAIRIGELLSEQKTTLTHGEWLPWIAANLKFPVRTAQRYMACWQNREKLNATSTTHLTIEDLAAHSEPKLEISMREIQRPISEENKVGIAVNEVPQPEPKPLFVSVKQPAEKPKPTEAKVIDPVEVKIAEMWKAYRGKKVTLGVFRSLVSDAAGIPGIVSIIKDALSKFEPPAAKASEAKKKPEPLILSDFDGEREVKWEVIKPPAVWHADASARYKIRCDKCESDVQLGSALPLDGNEKALASCNCKERGKRVERELRKL